MSTISQDREKAAIERQSYGAGSKTPLLTSDKQFTNPTGINEKALLWKLDLKLLPPLSLLYLLSFLDRSNSRFPSGFTPLSPAKTYFQSEMQSWRDLSQKISD